MRKFFIYISLIILTATLTLGPSFASIAILHTIEDVDFANEQKTEVEEEYSEAVLENKTIQYNSGNDKFTPFDFSKQVKTATFSSHDVAKEDLFLLHCSIIR